MAVYITDGPDEITVAPIQWARFCPVCFYPVPSHGFTCRLGDADSQPDADEDLRSLEIL